MYDSNGNIQGLKHNAPGKDIIDDLKYTYWGNQLTSITDNATGSDPSLGFNDGNKSWADYPYDANGNMSYNFV